MRAVLQRVKEASVTIEGQVVGAIGRGYLILLGVGPQDTEAQVEALWSKIYKLRIFEDDTGKTNLSLRDVSGDVLIVSQFTLFADCRKGNRPSFTAAGDPGESQRLYELFLQRVRQDIPGAAGGEFGADMQVSLVNDGPFTICLDTDDLKRPRRS